MCRNDIPLNLLVLAMILDKVWNAFGFCIEISLKVAQFLLSIVLRSKAMQANIFGLRRLEDDGDDSELAMVFFFQKVPL